MTAEPVALDISPAWTPTSKSINSLPEPLRRYIHDLEAVCDPASRGWSRDVSTEIARDLVQRVQRARAEDDELPGPVRQFVDWELEREERRRAVHLSEPSS